ncbi:TraB/GumN family protein [Bacteroides sp.]
MKKKYLGTLLLFCVALSANAQLLWRISGNGLSEPSYIMGTHHLAPLSIKDSIQGLQAALDQTQQVYGELKMSEMHDPATAATLMQKYMVTETDTTFKSLYTDEEYERINKCSKENLMFDISTMPKVKPVFLSNNLLVILYIKHVGGFNPQEQLDTYFQTQATEKGKKVDGLETMNFQLDLLYNKSSLKRQAETLLCLIDNIDENLELTKKLTSAYMAQDLATMEKISDEELCSMTSQEKVEMIDTRNKKWAQMLPGIMKSAPTFIAVGALHLPGENGVLNLLKQQGYTVEPVK